MRKKKCKNCGQVFTPDRPLQSCCGYVCAIEHSKKLAEKKNKSEQRKTLKAFNDKDINVLKRKAQTVFNQYIRLRDQNEPCISCGYSGDSRQFHAGHYRPAGNCAILRFDELNVHKQCSICNNHLSGNLVKYRENLINKIGLDQVELLDSTNDPRKYTIDEYAEIIKTYKQKIKDLR